MKPSAQVDEALRTVFAGRPWLLASDVLQGCTGTVARLRGWGAERCFAIAGRMGTGDPPASDDCEWRVLGLPEMGMMAAIHAGEEALRDLPADVQAAVDAFDPDRRMRVLGAIFSDGRPVAERPFFGKRRDVWRALEDKVVIDALWDETGVARAPSEVVEVSLRDLAAAAARMDRGAGTVWAGDATQGFHGGASFTRWVRPGHRGDMDRAVERLRSRCRTARVMPFLEGLPCSVHGIVFPEEVVVLRPAEMVTLRGRSGFTYGRAATFWDPPAADREAMRSAARRVGAHLRLELGYRGAFTIDGVLTEREGFLPTELNPRVGAAMGMMVRGFPFQLMNAALIEGVDLGVDPVELQAELLAQADAHRSGAIGFLLDLPIEESKEVALSWSDHGWTVTAADEPVDARLKLGPGATGGYASLVLDGDRTPCGRSVAPRGAALAAWLDAQMGTSIGPLRPAPDPTIARINAKES